MISYGLIPFFPVFFELSYFVSNNCILQGRDIMRSRFCMCIVGMVGFVFGVLFLGQQNVLAETIYKVSSNASRISFVGDSTLHKFHGYVSPIEGTLRVSGTSSDIEMAGAFRVKVADMSTDNRSRDKSMYAMFQNGRFPEIVFQINDVTMDSVATGSQGQINGVLKIRDKEQPFTVVTAVEYFKDQLALKGAFTVSLSDFDLKPPSVLGIIKVADPVDVDFEIRLESVSPEDARPDALVNQLGL